MAKRYRVVRFKNVIVGWTDSSFYLDVFPGFSWIFKIFISRLKLQFNFIKIYVIGNKARRANSCFFEGVAATSWKYYLPRISENDPFYKRRENNVETWIWQIYIFYKTTRCKLLESWRYFIIRQFSTFSSIIIKISQWLCY